MPNFDGRKFDLCLKGATLDIFVDVWNLKEKFEEGVVPSSLSIGVTFGSMLKRQASGLISMFSASRIVAIPSSPVRSKAFSRSLVDVLDGMGRKGRSRSRRSSIVCETGGVPFGGKADFDELRASWSIDVTLLYVATRS